ncbi:AMP-binding protein [Nesterenkonia sp. F]|uniref:AMP-binding protein n=1 Tax=Nesterenkonia sp. F TaxID=795955 RepID=UPI000255CCC6|nr:AMP-binding protein [Nesterenkonia sp. F]
MDLTGSAERRVSRALEALDAALRGVAAPVEFRPADDGVPTWTPRPDVADLPHLDYGDDADASAEPPAVVVRTSGSTGTPKQTLLSAAALRASAEATADALGGHGQWLLTLQPSYVAGLAVLSRSLVAGTTPVPLLTGTTDPDRFAEAAEQLTAERRFVSLVPTQLTRLLDADHDRATAALRRFDMILLGGGASSPELLDRAAAAGLRVVRTYGMSETCGGCVYDGHPLPGVGVSADEHGRISLSGPMVAVGYVDAGITADRFDVDPATGHRRFLTDDLGALSTVAHDAAGTHASPAPSGVTTSIVPRLTITGRVDDVITTGGVKVSAEQVRAVLLEHPGVAEAFVGGVADRDWGQTVRAAVVLGAVSRTDDVLDALHAGVRERLGPAAVPKSLQVLPALPLLPTGKPDRRRLLALLAEDRP